MILWNVPTWCILFVFFVRSLIEPRPTGVISFVRLIAQSSNRSASFYTRAPGFSLRESPDKKQLEFRIMAVQPEVNFQDWGRRHLEFRKTIYDTIYLIVDQTSSNLMELLRL